MTGIGTVLTDDPRLDVRFGQTTLQPLRVVVDSQLRMPSGARIVGEPGRCLVVTKLADAAKAQTLNDVGVEVLVQTDSSVQVDLKTLVNVLSARGVNELHIEAGSQLNGSLLKLDLVDELLIYLAPRIIGLGVRMASIDRVNYFDELAAFKFIETKSIGCDIRVLARRSSSDRY